MQPKTTANEQCACDQCGQLFASPLDVSSHQRRRHSFGQLPRQCDDCGSSAHSATELSNHFQKHHTQGLKPKMQCADCKHLFVSEATLEHHRRTKHRKQKETMRVCDDCGLQNAAVSHFANAHKVKEDATTVCCEECGMRFSGKLKPAYLLRHLNQQHGVRLTNLFCCDECDLSFDLKSAAHMHTIQKHLYHGMVFSCDVCEVKFGSEKGMKSHKRNVHSDRFKVRVECNDCHKSFANTSALGRHIRSVDKQLEAGRCQE